MPGSSSTACEPCRTCCTTTHLPASPWAGRCGPATGTDGRAPEQGKQALYVMQSALLVLIKLTDVGG